MKKVVSLLLAVVTVIGISTAAFAAVDDIYDESGIRSFNTASPRINYGISGGNVSVVANELVLVEDKNDNPAIIMPEAELEPGTEYKFRVYRATRTDNDASPSDQTLIAPVTAQDLGTAKLRIRGIKGTSVISSAKLDKRGSGNTAYWRLTINTKENWGTKETDVEYRLDYTGNPDITLVQGEQTFVVGYGRYTDDDIDAFGEGDIVTISNDYPVITKSQFETLAKNNNYRSIQFEADDGMWSYLGRVSGMGDNNFKYTRDVVPAIVEKFEDQNFEFLTFGAGVTFPTNGEMRIDVSDFSADFDKMYTYLYRNGKLTPISASYDTGSDEIVFRTNYLGSFVITDEEITDTTIIDVNPGEETPAEEVPGGSDNNENPSTGTAGNVGAAIALGTIAAAAAISLRKRG